MLGTRMTSLWGLARGGSAGGGIYVFFFSKRPFLVFNYFPLLSYIALCITSNLFEGFC